MAEVSEGPGPVVMGLHGWGRTRRDMVGLVAGRACLLPDLPGFGASEPPPAAWGAADYAELIARVAEDDARGPYLVVGHSFGGRVAVCLASSRPDIVAGVVLAGVPLLRTGGNRKPALSFRIARAANRLGFLSDSRMEKERLRRGSPDYVAAQGVMRQVLVRVVGEDYSAQLRALDCPVGFCWGADDHEVSPDVARRAAQLVGRVAALSVVEGAGHDVHLSHPEQLKAVMRSVEAPAP